MKRFLDLSRENDDETISQFARELRDETIAQFATRVLRMHEITMDNG